MVLGICSGRAAGALFAAAVMSGAAAGGGGAESDAGSPGVIQRLLERSDGACGDETAEQARARRTLLLDMVARTPRCYVANPTPEELDYILLHFHALPVGGLVQDGPNNRFFTSGQVWSGAGGQSSSGQAAGAMLRYSFPNDGVGWNGADNVLNARLSGQFGASNVDRGREYIRQALASWRKNSGLRYTEVADTQTAFSFSSSNAGGGDIRIGAIPQGAGGVLAYNFFPDSGGDMVINADELNTGRLFAGTNNYRYLRNVVAHEHGHGLGFIHPTPCNSTKLMEPFASTSFEMTQIDEIRGSQRNYGDRFAGNNSAANAKDFGDLTAPILRSVIERTLSTNGATGANGTQQDWFRFTLGSAQSVTITVAPTGGSYANGQQTGDCNPTNPGTVNAMQAGNLNVELRDSTGGTVVQQAASAAAGVNEVIAAGTLSPGTYTVRVVDVGPNPAANQFVQLYDLTIRVGGAKAPPQVIAGVPKRVAAGQACFFMGDLNSRVNEPGAALNSASYDWDLDGDGIFETNDRAQPTHTYTFNGVFNATLRVTDSNGMSATDTIAVSVVGAVSGVESVTPGAGPTGATIPVTIVGVNLGGVTSAGQVSVSGGGVTVSGVPAVSAGGTVVNGLSFVISAGAAEGARNLVITNADGLGQGASASGVFSVTNTPPGNDGCETPISWGSVTGARPFTNINASTGAPQSFPATGCPAGGPINNDVWYSWIAPTTGNLNVSTDSATGGAPTVFSSRVAAYSGSACPPATVLGCDDFFTPFNIFVIGGQRYLFQVGSVNAGQSGTANVVLALTPLMGACCDSSGGCAIMESSQCVGTSAFVGIGTTCEVPGCPQTLGTCCAADGSCALGDVGLCDGVFVPGGACDPNPCPQPSGSCCGVDQSCIERTQADCTDGRVWALGSVCTPNPCPQPAPGACCTGTACVITAQLDCAGVFKGAGVECGALGNPIACCPANFDRVGGVNVQDIFAYLTAYFGSLPAADFDGAGGSDVQDIFAFLGAYFTGCPG